MTSLWKQCVKGLKLEVILGIIHLVRTQSFPENLHFLPPDMLVFRKTLRKY